MDIENLELKDAFIIHPDVFRDDRGWFMESFSTQKMPNNITYIQDNHSFSKGKGVLRGLHIQLPPFTQSKLIRCTRGKILDVIVDVRESSPSYLNHKKIILSDENFNILFVPKGFLHGFVTLAENVEVQYKVDAFYNKESERSVLYNDPLFGIDWGQGEFILSEKDKKAPLYKKELETISFE